MNSLIASLSLLVVAYATVCFALPVVKEQFSSSTVGSFNDDLTTESINEQRMPSYNTRENFDAETTMKSVLPSEESSNGNWAYETSTSVDHQESHEQFTRPARMFDDLSTSEMNTMSSEHVMTDRERQEEPFETTLETSTEFHDHTLRGVQSDDEDHEQYTTVTDEMIKREFQEEPITSTYAPSFASTSSAAAPHLYTKEPMTSSRRSTTRRADRVEVRVDEQHEEEDKPAKHVAPKAKKAPMKKHHGEEHKDKSHEDKSHEDKSHEDKSHEDKSHEDKSHEEDSQVPSAVYDGTLMHDISTLPTNEMQVEKNDQIIEIPKDLLRPMKTNGKSSKQPLSQGQKQPIPEEEKSNH